MFIMKLKLVALFILLISFVQAESSFKSEYQENQPKKAYNFSYKFGKETVKLQFPAKPKIMIEDGEFAAILLKDNMEYALFAPKPPIALDPEDVFSFYLDNIDDAYLVEDQTITDNIMELTLIDTEEGMVVKMNIVVTPKNFYILGAAYPQGYEDPSIENFLNSFKIN